MLSTMAGLKDSGEGCRVVAVAPREEWLRLTGGIEVNGFEGVPRSYPARLPYRSSGLSLSACGPEPAPPMLKMLPALPMLRIEPALPMDKIEPALPMLKTLPKLKMLPTLP